MVFLRGHHLICLHFYRGQGYQRDFVENLERVLKHAESEGVTVTEGPDDVCRACPYLEGSFCSYSETSEEEIREMDRKALGLLSLSPGDNALWQGIKEYLPEVLPVWYDSFCSSCHWLQACRGAEEFNK
jgi:hypothetical protein